MIIQDLVNFLKTNNRSGARMVVHTCNLSIAEARSGGSGIQVIVEYTVRLSQKQTKGKEY